MRGLRWMTLCGLVCSGAWVDAEAAYDTVLKNAAVEVRYDGEAGLMQWVEGTDGQVYADDIDVGKGGQTETYDGNAWGLGAGEALSIPAGDGKRLRVVLFADSPFVFFEYEWENHGNEEEWVDSSRFPRLPLCFEEDAERLKALGTKGLTAPDGHPGSYSALAIAEPASRRGVVAGWLTHEQGSGIVFSGKTDAGVYIEGETQYQRLCVPAGAGVRSEIFAVGFFEDARLGLEAYADAAARANHVQLPPQPCGYCTWYSQPHGGASDETHLIELAEFAAEKLKPYGLDFIQIDDYWQGPPRQSHTLDAKGLEEDFLGKPEDGKERWWWGPHSDFTNYNPKGPYGGGMKPVAERLHALGFTPGLWLMPFAWDPLCDALRGHHDWFVKQPDGSLYYTMWSGWCLDMTHPEARAFLGESIARITGAWGFQYLKLDGLWAGTATTCHYVHEEYKEDGLGEAVFHDEHMTPIAAYRAGLKTVRKAAGKETFILGCNVSQNMRTLGASFGLVDAMRIGPDNGPKWNDLKAGPWHGSNRYFYHGRVWYNDPDPVYVRESMPLEHARLLCSWAGMTGQFTVASDWLPNLPEERLDILRRVLPAHGLLPRPVDLFDQDLPRVWLLTDERAAQPRYVIGLFNWDEEHAARMTCSYNKLGLPDGMRYAAFDFWGACPVETGEAGLDVEVPAGSCRILVLRPHQDVPFVLSTNRHVTQGAADIVEEVWDGQARELRGRSRMAAGDAYVLRIVPEGWKILSAENGYPGKRGLHGICGRTARYRGADAAHPRSGLVAEIRASETGLMSH